MIKKIKKRDGRIVDFEPNKITEAIWKAAQAVGGKDKELSKKLSAQVVEILEKKYDGISREPTVEEIQDIVEKVLIENGHAKTAKAYILYRQQHKELRELRRMVGDLSVVDKYLDEKDWRVRENSNMTYSLQGLNFHISSKIISNYWLNKIYPPEIRQAYNSGDFHIHDLGIFGAYCVGWDLQDLLLSGFKGVSGKIETKPAKHLRVALGQIINFFYTLQGEAAGAQAFSNFDTLLAPFIRYDNLNYKQVKQAMQEFLFNINVPTRVGFQCVSEDTEILTPEGWARYDEIKRGSIIKTFNVKTGKIENQRVRRVFKKHYKGIMYNLKNHVQDQLISPKHRVVRKNFQTSAYILEPIEDVIKLKSPFIIPIAGKNSNKEATISDEQIKLMAWIISEGTIERPTKYRHCYRISIYQSKEKNKKNYKEIIKLLKHFKLKYSEYESAAFDGKVARLRLDAKSSRKIHKWFGTRDNISFVPDILLNMNERQSKLFIQTYLKADGFENCKIATTNLEILDALQIIAVNAGYGFTVLKRKPTIGSKDIYVLRLIKHKETYIQKITKVNYNGIIWCPNTKNETVIARRNGKVFITGNTPFTNITLDLEVPSYMKNEPVIIGGKPQKESYSDFQKEMNMINRAFAEMMLEGDAKGRVFTFPIPTYNITKNFEWDKEDYKPLWEMTAKYGVPYFANFINSDMKPDDVRSMCPLDGEEKVLIKSNRGRRLEYSSIRNIYEGNSKTEKYEIYSDGKFVKGKFNKFPNQKMIEIALENGHKIKMSSEHLNFVMRGPDAVVEELKGEQLEEGMYLPYSLNVYEGNGGNADLGYFVGAYAGDGSLDRETTVVFSLGAGEKKTVAKKLKQIAEKYFGAHCTTKEYDDTKLFTLRIHSKAAVGLCKDFVSGIKREKHYKSRIFGMSLEFRKGVLEGHYATDGGNRNRIYTSSKKMLETLNMLAATLGTTTSVYEDSRDGRLGEEPNYSVLVYQLNRNNYGDFWFKHDNKLWIKIKSIKQLKNNTAYCFEVENGEPMFTVGTTGILTHNCRLRIDNRELKKRGGGLFGANPLTGSIGVVTINMPKIGYMSKTEEEFFEKLEKNMDLAKKSLEIKRKIIENFTEKGLYPYSRFYLRSIKQKTGKYWKNHFSTIGLIGMNEALLNFMGVNIADEKGRKFAEKVLDFMRNKLQSYQQETGNIYNLEATPAEGASHRLARLDKKNYPDIIVANEENYRRGAAPYYTNSTQLPVDYTDDIFEALKLQDNLQCKYTGGTVLHGFIGESMPSPEATKNLIRKIAENFRLPYFTITPTFSICPIHGYIPGKHYYCPICATEN